MFLIILGQADAHDRGAAGAPQQDGRADALRAHRALGQEGQQEARGRRRRRPRPVPLRAGAVHGHAVEW